MSYAIIENEELIGKGKINANNYVEAGETRFSSKINVMVLTSDISDTIDIHPKNKKDVGIRLANLALAEMYKTNNNLVNGPLFKDFKVEKNKAIVSFDYADGLYFKNKTSNQFEVAGADGIFYPAEASIKNNQVLLTSKKVSNPAKVRFAWGNTVQSDLFNKANLPASCFITE